MKTSDKIRKQTKGMSAAQITAFRDHYVSLGGKSRATLRALNTEIWLMMRVEAIK